MNKSKYIVYDDGMIEHAIIFDAIINHSDVAHALRANDSILGAGFVSIGVDKNGEVSATPYGKSISLGVESRKEDEKFIRFSLGLI